MIVASYGGLSELHSRGEVETRLTYCKRSLSILYWGVGRSFHPSDYLNSLMWSTLRSSSAEEEEPLQRRGYSGSVLRTSGGLPLILCSELKSIEDYLKKKEDLLSS